MDLRQLAALTAVADHHSFSAAARALHTVQSNVSTHIAHLERELGASLVDRTSGRLTDAGELVVARARRIQAELEALTADVASSIGDISGVGPHGHDRHDRTLADPQAAPGDRCRPSEGQGRPDRRHHHLARAPAGRRRSRPGRGQPAGQPSRRRRRSGCSTKTTCWSSRRITRWPSATSVDLTELASHPLLMEPLGTGFRDDLEGDAARAGIRLEPQAEIDGMRLLASLAFEAFGVAVLPASAVPPGRGRGAVAAHPAHRLHAAIGRARRATARPAQRPGAGPARRAGRGRATGRRRAIPGCSSWPPPRPSRGRADRVRRRSLACA